MLALAGDTSNLVIYVLLHLLLVQYVRPRFFLVFSSKKPRAGGGCWKLCSTSPVRAYITRMELNRGDGAWVGSRGAPRVLSSRVRGTRGVGTPFGPTKNHPLSLSHQQAGNHEPICFLGFLRPYIMPRFLVGGYIIMPLAG